jgi:hypothetical protein
MPAELPSAAIADAGPIIHLDELGVLSVLGGFREVLVPDVVAMEAERHRPTWRSRAPAGLRTESPPQERMENFLRVGSLAVGEAAALALWREHPMAVLLCDWAVGRHAGRPTADARRPGSNRGRGGASRANDGVFGGLSPGGRNCATTAIGNPWSGASVDSRAL